MFVFSDTLTFPWPVKVLEPDQNNPGKLIEYEFTGIFNLIDRDTAKANDQARTEILGRSYTETDAQKLRTILDELEAHDKVTVLQAVAGWDDRLVDGKTKKPIPYSEKTARMLLKHSRVQAAFMRAYAEAISEDKARLGN